MNKCKNARALRRGLLVILLVRYRQTPLNPNTLKSSALFLCVILKRFYGTIKKIIFSFTMKYSLNR